jgi:hypothetical protein
MGLGMHFRLKLFSLHLLSSATVLSLILGSLYFGWYRWPGWYLTDVTRVILVMVCVDVVLGPTLTLIIANQKKSTRELTRDIGIIVVVQLCALSYGSVSLWNGRPLYYAFSESVLQLVQAYDIDAIEAQLGRDQNPGLAPHWYSLPRWIWAPLPKDSEESEKIELAATLGGDDVTAMPRYYKPWEEGLPELRANLKKVDDLKYFTPPEKEELKAQMQAAGFAADQANTLAFSGRAARPLLAVFDPTSLKIQTLFHVTEQPRPQVKSKHGGWFPFHRKKPRPGSVG